MRILLLILIISLVFPQGWYNHPELEWKTIETKHFFIHYHNETYRSAQEAAAIAEKIYSPITSFYEFEPDTKTHIIIQDTDDIANGAAYYYDNKIIIWALPLDFDLRGSHRWLNNVITHEFTHIIQIGTAMKYSRKFPAAFFQLMGYEDEKREDVLYGYPNILMSYPLPGVSVPPWLAEGTAQFMYPGADFDFWDSHRDMIVRDRILNNNLLSFDAMNTFGKRGIGNESTYNQGFLFSSWMSKNYGIDVLKKISQSLSSPINYSINYAIRDATGQWGDKLYEQWKEDLQMYYDELSENISQSERKGIIIISDGTTNIHPVWSPDGKRFAYLSNQDNDYFGQTDLFIYTFSDSTSEKVAGGVKTAPTWVNDSTLVYTKRSKPNKWGSKYFDLFRYTFSDKEEQRLTYNSRLISPVYNYSLNNITAITSFDGTSNIMIAENIDILDDTLHFQSITQFDNGIQLLSLAWHEGRLIVDGVYHQGRQIYEVKMENGELEPITSGRWENRDQDSGSSGIIYTSDKSGINNLVLSSGGHEYYITNVIGGAFMPSISDNGTILYSLYENGGYNIVILKDYAAIDESQVGYEENYFLKFPLSDLILGENLESLPYEEKMLSMSFFPKVMLDYKTIKPGFYFMGNEVLDRFSIFGGASTNRLLDLDLFLLLEYRKFFPTFYTNLFWISRHRDAKDPFLYPRVNGDDVDNIEIYNDLAFNLFSSDIGTRFALGHNKIKIQYNYSNYREHVEQNVYQYFKYNDIDTVIWQYGEIGFDYFRGHSVSLIYELKMRERSYAMNMLPRNGWKFKGDFSYEWNQFMDGFAASEEYSTYGAKFIPHNTARFTGEVEQHFTLNKEKLIVATLSGIGGGLSKPDVDDFFHFFGGGLPGIKGYTFYEESLTGPYYFVATAAIRLPVFLEKNYTWAQFNMQNLSIGGIFQFGSAIQDTDSFSGIIKDDHYKLSAGLEYRLHGFSFYSYPSAIAYEYHQPLSDLDEKGKHYFTILFDY